MASRRLPAPVAAIRQSGLRPMQAVVVGAGYVGLVTSACLAHLGHHVKTVDLDVRRIESLRNGVTPISEPGLDVLVRDGSAAGRLAFGTDLRAALSGADVMFIAVGTLDASGRWTDANVRSVLADALASGTVPRVVVVRSTLRPGVMRRLQRIVEASGQTTRLVLNPEFTRQGSAVTDFLQPHRVVVGTADGDGADDVATLRRLYAGISAPFLVVDHATAELIKIGANAFLATKITFANELARVAAGSGASIARVMEGIGLDPRIGQAFLQPGPGFGGSCLPNQVDLLTTMSDELDLGLELIPAVQRGNRGQPRRLADEFLRISRVAEHIAIFGLAFKANTDDTRESPALRFIDALSEAGVREIRAYDPAVRRVPSHAALRIFDDPYEAAHGSDALAITTEWAEFQALDWRRLAVRMRGRIVFDTRSIVDAAEARRAGFDVRLPGSGGSNADRAAPIDRTVGAPSPLAASVGSSRRGRSELDGVRP